MTFNFFGRQLIVGSSGVLGLLTLLFLAALGGLLLNFTPCVLPVLPIKIMGMSRAAGDPRRLAVLGLVMSLGVVAFWLAIGGAIAFIAGFTAISSLFQTTWFSLVVGLFVAVVALGGLGLFEVVLPQAIYRYQPKQETLPGAFGFGIMTAILSTPCTAPFHGHRRRLGGARAAGHHPDHLRRHRRRHGLALPLPQPAAGSAGTGAAHRRGQQRAQAGHGSGDDGRGRLLPGHPHHQRPASGAGTRQP